MCPSTAPIRRVETRRDRISTVCSSTKNAPRSRRPAGLRSCPQSWCNSGGPGTERPPRHPRVVGVATDDTEGHHDGRGQDGRARDCCARRSPTATSTSCARASGCSPRRSWRPRSAELTGLAKGERDPERRLTHRNGYRERRWDTRVGTIDLAIPRVRDGCTSRRLLEPRRRAERALLAVVQEAYVSGVSTRRVDDLVRALGIEGISRSEVSRICAALDAEVEAFRVALARGRGVPLPVARRHLPQGARGGPGRVDGGARRGRRRPHRRAPRAGPRARRRATTRARPGRRFIRALVERGLHGVRLVISDDHAGLVKAVREQLLGAALAALPGALHAQRPGPRARARRGAWSPRPSAGLRAARRARPPAPSSRGSSTACGRASRRSPTCSPRPSPTCSPTSPSPRRHRRQIRSTNPLERLNKEIKRRTGVVGHLPQPGARDPPGRDDPRRAGRRVAGRPALLPARDHGAHRRRHRPEEVGPALLMAS